MPLGDFGFGQSALQGFQLGKSLAPENPIGILAKSVLERYNKLSELKATSEFEAQAKVTYDPSMQFLKSLQGGQSGTTLAGLQSQLPQGVSLKAGPFTISQPIPPAPIQQAQVSTKDALSNVDRLEMLAQHTGVTQSGFLSQVGQSLGSRATGGRSNPDLRLYMDQATANAAGIYRALTGDNRLSDRDAAMRALPLLWRPERGEPYETVGKRKFEMLRQAFRRREALLANGKSVNEIDEVVNPSADPDDFEEF